MESNDKQYMEFNGIENFRNVGISVKGDHSVELRDNLLFRCARPEGGDANDIDKLRNKLNVNVIFDLRSPQERAEAQLEPNCALHFACARPHFRVVCVDFYRTLMPYLIKRASISTKAKLATFYAIGMRKKAVRVLCEATIQPLGLSGLLNLFLDTGKVQFRKIFTELALLPPNQTVLVHCSIGKDRTGITIALILLILNVPHDAILRDYVASEPGLSRIKPDLLVKFGEMGLSPEFVNCPSSTLQQVFAYLESKYGGAERYIVDHCKVPTADLNRIRAYFLKPN